MNLTIGELVNACGGKFYGEPEAMTRQITGVTSDSRQAEAGVLFIATVGERVDGHSFLADVMQRGAACGLGEQPPQAEWRPYIQVRDSFQALKDIAAYYRRKLTAQVIGITGSVGKTSTKEFIASVLSVRYQTLKTQGNLNNEVGLPLTVLRIGAAHEKAVLEMGISNFGEMHRLSAIAAPDICVLTNIGQCHLENLGSREGILRAKSEIFDCMNPQGSVCVNGDDDMLASIGADAGRRPYKKPLTFGLSRKNDIYADEIVSKGLFGSEAVIHTERGSFTAQIPLPGEHMVYNALAATAVGLLCDMELTEIAQGIASVKAMDGRSHIMHGRNAVVIDDCYNANPVSMQAAIDLLCMAQGHKTAILGDMFELGEQERQLHAQVGAYAVRRGVDAVYCTGALSREMYQGALAAAEETGLPCKILFFPDREALISHLRQEPLRDTTVLVKASHGMHFETIVKELV